MLETKNLRVSVADAKSFERGSFKTYALDEQNGVSVVVAKDPSDGVVKAQSFVFDLSKNASWDFQSAESYAKASIEDVNKLVVATKGSIAFKTLAEAASRGQKVTEERIRKGLNVASLDPAVADLLVAAQRGEKAAEINFDEIDKKVARY